MSAPDPDELNALLQRGYRFALSLTHDVTSAEDLVQEACVALSRRGGPWVWGYLASAIRSRFIDGYRRQQKIRFRPLEVGEEPRDETQGEGAESLGGGLDPALERALGRLRAEERELLYWAWVEGRTAQEISELTERPRGTVLSALHRAKQKLRRELAEEPARDAS